MSYKIVPSDTFEREVKRLSKKFKNIKIDLKYLLETLQDNPFSGTSLGKRIFKIRVPNSSIPTGKSGGFRVITLIRIEKEKIFLLTIYSKTEKDDISDIELKDILEGIE
jgi:mRNA-degrading endonuclease RelE of RelBE toxin-antitoxin system